MNKKINLKALEKVKDTTKNIYHNYFSISAIKEITTNFKELGLKNSFLSIFGKIYNRYFDARYNLDTISHTNQKLVVKQGLQKEQTIHASKYDDSSYLAIKALFSYLKPCSEKVLLDIGSGKGTVLLASLEFNFKEVIGIEHSEYLCSIASSNLEKFKKKRNNHKEIKIIPKSAIDYQFQDNENLLYFFNPFDEYMSEKFLTLVQASQIRNKRKISIVSRAWQGEKLISEKLNIRKSKTCTFWGKDFKIFEVY